MSGRFIAAFVPFTLFLASIILYNDSRIVKKLLEVGLFEDFKFAEYETTVVFHYFTLNNSRHDASEYMDWAAFSLCIDDPAVIFTSPDLVDHFKELRSHAENRTLIAPLNIDDIQTGNTRRGIEFWEEQNGPKNYNLYKLWLAKTWLVNQAINLNPFNSNKYVHMDIGHFREGPFFCGKTVVRHPEVIPKDRIVLYPYRALEVEKKDMERDADPIFSEGFWSFYIAGGVISGGKDVWPIYLDKIEESIDIYKRRSVRLTDDQPVMQSTCMRNPGLCYVTRWDAPYGEGNGDCLGGGPGEINPCIENGGWTGSSTAINGFFIMKYRLYHGGDLKTMYWDNGLGTPSPEEDPGLYMSDGIVRGR